MKVGYLHVKSLEDYLENQIQAILKNPYSLKTGKPFTNIKLRPREVLGAFLICAVIRSISEQNWTIARDPMEGDGVVLCMDKSRFGDGAFLEQVYVPRLSQDLPVSMEEIVKRIEIEIKKKHRNGKPYYENKHLVIFLDIEGQLDYQKVKKIVDDLEEGFDSYWLFASWDKQYSYLVFFLKANRDQPALYNVKINEDFKGWSVERLGRL
jgi:hypothetical protein